MAVWIAVMPWLSGFAYVLIIHSSLLPVPLSWLSYRWSAYVEDGTVKVLNVEKAPSEFKVSGGDHILAQM